MKIIIELSDRTARFIGFGMFILGGIFLILSLIASATIDNVIPAILLILFSTIFFIFGFLSLIFSIK
ncbi:MAG: hypothetical protein ACK4YO_00350 [Candidatus Altarchaeaceae archaeon]